MSQRYLHPHPSPEAEASHPFVDLDFVRYPVEEMRRRADEFRLLFSRRRSVRMISNEPVPAELIESAIITAGSAPSGAHLQPWHFVAISDPDVKLKIRLASEAEERTNYLDNRMNEEWQSALEPLGTDWHKEFIEIAPWIVVLFEQRFQVDDDGARRHNYYVKESCGIAAGLFICAIHNMGLVTLTHTPTPMAFLSSILGRPENERASIVFPVGFPVAGTRVPDLKRKSLDEISTIITAEHRSA